MSDMNEPGTTKFFGMGAVKDPNRVEVPVGQKCVYCEEVIELADPGFMIPQLGLNTWSYSPWHRECFLRTVVGSVSHQRRQCRCYGGEGEDDLNLTRRAAAKAAILEFDKTLWLTRYMKKPGSPMTELLIQQAQKRWREKVTKTLQTGEVHRDYVNVTLQMIKDGKDVRLKYPMVESVAEACKRAERAGFTVLGVEAVEPVMEYEGG
jgi:hypothetical protein